MTDHTGASYAKIDTKLLWPNWSGTNCDENQIWQHITDCTYAVYVENEA